MTAPAPDKAYRGAVDFITDPTVVEWGAQPPEVTKGGEPPRRESLANSLRVTNGKVHAIFDKLVELTSNARDALRDPTIVPWGRQPTDKDGKPLLNEDGTVHVETESVANSLRVTNQKVHDILDRLPVNLQEQLTALTAAVASLEARVSASSGTNTPPKASSTGKTATS